MLQLVGGRLLAPYIGSSLETWTAVIGMVLAGISFGNWLGGRLADRAASGTTLRLLLWFGAAALLSTLGIVRVLGDGELVRPIALFPRIALLTFLVCFPSAFVLSLTTPVAIKLLLPDVRNTGRIVGMVYALGTLGSLIGNFVTGFALMAIFGITAIILGVAALLFALSFFVPKVTANNTVTEVRPDRTLAVNRGDALPLNLACVIVFVASFCSMGLELCASRLLAPSVGVSIYSWTGIIGVVLAGVVIGNSLGGWVADRWTHRRTLSLSLFSCGLLTLMILVLFALVGQHHQSIDGWIGRTFGTVQASFDATTNTTQLVDSGYTLQAKIVIYAAAFFLLPMIAFGTISPQVTRLAVTDWDHAGQVAGRVYAWSCAGAIAGTFATGWFLIGEFGVLRLFASAGAVMAIMAIPVGRLWTKPLEFVGTTCVAVVAMVVLAVGAERFLRFSKGSLYEKETNYYLIRVQALDADDTHRHMVLDQLVHSSAKGMWQEENGSRAWKADVSYLGYGHEQIQAEFARVAADLHPRPNVLVIGGGGYTLPRWVERFIPQATMDVVEIDPGVTEAVYNVFGMTRQTRIKSFNVDGRQFIQETATPGHYHLVIQDAVNDLSVPWHIMTKEYNDAVKRTMAIDGVYLLTIIDEFGSGRLLPAAVRTMKETFPHVCLLSDEARWEGKSKSAPYVIAGTPTPVDPATLQATLKRLGHGDMRTKKMPDAILKQYLATGKPTVLTDDFAPVDNLMAATFRRR